MSSVDDWDPLALDAVQSAFTGAPFRWWICGGLALELHVGRVWRSHEDLDIGILREDAPAVYSWLAEWDLWVAAGGSLRPWHGEPLDSERDENNVWARRSVDLSWSFDLTVGSGNDAEWIYRRNETVRRDWHDAVLRTPEGLPYIAPEIQLLFKSKNPRPKDELDARQVIPLLDPIRRDFLSDHLDGGHPWQALTTMNATRPVQVVAGLLREGDRVLLCHRRTDRSHYPDVWDLPGGRVEEGETLGGALTRELREELGIVARLSDEAPWVTLMNDTLDFHIYLIDHWQGVPDNLATDEHDEIRWSSARELADLNLADNAYVKLVERVLT